VNGRIARAGRGMRRVLLVLGLAAAPTSSRAQDAAMASIASIDRASPWTRWLGEWRAVDAGGNPGRARFTWSRGVGPHLFRVQTYLAAEGRPEEQIYDGWLFWHPGRQCYVLQQFSSWGSIYDGTARTDDKGMTYDWASFENGATKHYRSTSTWIDADSFSWRVEQETPSGWTIEREGVWKRAK
jgi:hypothetical protein